MRSDKAKIIQSRLFLASLILTEHLEKNAVESQRTYEPIYAKVKISLATHQSGWP